MRFLCIPIRLAKMRRQAIPSVGKAVNKEQVALLEE